MVVCYLKRKRPACYSEPGRKGTTMTLVNQNAFYIQKLTFAPLPVEEHQALVVTQQLVLGNLVGKHGSGAEGVWPKMSLGFNLNRQDSLLVIISSTRAFQYQLPV